MESVESPVGRRSYRFRLVDVFATDTPFSGNPLAVFEDGRGLSDTEMASIARQTNLSETTFVFPPDDPRATARVRIFTPSYEMPFAGHPTLGTAHVVAGAAQPVVRPAVQAVQAMYLSLNVGLVGVTAAEPGAWTLSLPEGKHRAPAVGGDVVAAAVGVDPSEVAGPPLWVNTGTEQLILPLRSTAAVTGARVDPARYEALPKGVQPTKILLWAMSGPDRVLARFFFPAGGQVLEDPGTGSACANLGGYLLATGRTLPIGWDIDQGAQTGRPCRLRLDVTADREIRVGGRVVDVGAGVLWLSPRE